MKKNTLIELTDEQAFTVSGGLCLCNDHIGVADLIDSIHDECLCYKHCCGNNKLSIKTMQWGMGKNLKKAKEALESCIKTTNFLINAKPLEYTYTESILMSTEILGSFE